VSPSETLGNQLRSRALLAWSGTVLRESLVGERKERTLELALDKAGLSAVLVYVRGMLCPVTLAPRPVLVREKSEKRCVPPSAASPEPGRRRPTSGRGELAPSDLSTHARPAPFVPCAPRCCAQAALSTVSQHQLAPAEPASTAASSPLVNLRLSLSPSPTKARACPAQLYELSMQDYDPLHPAAYDPASRSARPGSASHQPHHPDAHLSSVARRSPLVGYDRDYRAPGSSAAAPPGQGSAWSSAADGDAWGGSGGGASSAGGLQRAQGQGQGGSMVPRDPRTVEGPGQRRSDDGAAGGPSQQGQQQQQQQQAREGFIRVRILGLERNKRDLYVKFNVEVRPHLHRSRPRRGGALTPRPLSLSQTNLPNFHHSSCASSSLLTSFQPRTSTDVDLLEQTAPSRARTPSSPRSSPPSPSPARSRSCPPSRSARRRQRPTTRTTGSSSRRSSDGSSASRATRPSSATTRRGASSRATLACVPLLLRSSIHSHSDADSLLDPLQYTPRARKKSSAPSIFSRASRLPGELDDPLTAAKVSMSRLETTFNDASKVLDKVSKKRREAATSVSELGDQLETFAMAEPYAPLAGGFKRLARTMKVDADLLAAQVRRASSAASSPSSRVGELTSFPLAAPAEHERAGDVGRRLLLPVGQRQVGKGAPVSPSSRA